MTTFLREFDGCFATILVVKGFAAYSGDRHVALHIEYSVV